LFSRSFDSLCERYEGCVEAGGNFIEW
jgi:hypothetical protein